MEYSTRAIPKSLKDCVKENEASSKLYDWADRLRSLSYLAVIIIVISLCIGTGNVYEETVETLDSIPGYSETETTTAAITAALTHVLWGVAIIVIELIACHWVSALLIAAGQVVQSTQIAADVALYNASVKTPQKQDSSSNSNSKKSNKDTRSNSDSKKQNKATHNDSNSAEPNQDTHSNSDSKRIPVIPIKDGLFSISCPTCKTVQSHTNFICEKCHQVFINGQLHIPYWCSECGYEGPYDDNCPKCGSNYIIENTSIK